VDDQPGRLAALEAALEGMGDDVETVRALSGKDALRCLLKRDFAVILLDVHMPVVDGFETAALVRQRQKSEQTPIIFITAFGPNEAQVTRGYSLGAVDYIFAPVQGEVLRAKVGVFLDLYRKTAQVKRQADWLREEAERRAARLETRLRGLLDRLEVGVFRATPEGRIVEANRAFLALLGVPEAARVPRSTVDLLLAPGPGGAAGARDLLLPLPAGGERWVSVSTSAAPDSGDESIVKGIIEDVTARKSAEEALREAHAALTDQARRLEQSNTDLQRFAHLVSHDLQEPLKMVSTFSDLLGRRVGASLDGESRRCLEFVREGAERMQGMVRSLLDFCLLEKTEGRSRPADCGALVDRALGNLAASVSESGGEVTRDRLPVVHGDDLLLTSVFQNLIANALKFRREGVPPRVHVGGDAVDGEWVLSVRDNGIGFDPAAAGELFGFFRRLPGSEAYPGSGMGLAICKRIVERHGGRIWAEPAEGGGSVFRFSIPRRPEGAREAPA
jgi:signal transduction histidine kinase